MSADLKDVGFMFGTQPTASLPTSLTPAIQVGTAPTQLSDPTYRSAQRANAPETKTINDLKQETENVDQEAEARKLRYRDYMRRNPYREDLKDVPPPVPLPQPKIPSQPSPPTRLTAEQLRAETRDYYLRKSVVKTPTSFASLQASLQASILPAVFMFLPFRSINSNVGAAVERYTNFANKMSKRADFYLLEMDNSQFATNALPRYGNIPTATDPSTIKYPILSLVLPNPRITQRIAFGPYPVEDSGEGFTTIESLLPTGGVLGGRRPVESGADTKYSGITTGGPKCPTKLYIWALTGGPGKYVLMTEQETPSIADWPDVVQTRILTEVGTDSTIRTKTHHVAAASWVPEKKRHYGMLFNYDKLLRPGSDASEAIVAENWFGEEVKCRDLEDTNFYEWIMELKSNPQAAPPSPRPGPSPISVGPSGGRGGAPPLLFGPGATRPAKKRGGGIMPTYRMPPELGTAIYPAPILYSSIDERKGFPYATYLQISTPLDPESKNLTYTLSPPRVQYQGTFNNKAPAIAAFTQHTGMQQMVFAGFEQVGGKMRVQLILWKRDNDKKEVDCISVRSGTIYPISAALPSTIDTNYLETITTATRSVPSKYQYTNTQTKLPVGIPYTNVPVGEYGWIATYNEDKMPSDPTSLNYKYQLFPLRLQKLNNPSEAHELDMIIRTTFLNYSGLKRLVAIQITRDAPDNVLLTFSQYGRIDDKSSIDLLRRGTIKAKGSYLPYTFTTRDLENFTQLVRAQ